MSEPIEVTRYAYEKRPHSGPQGREAAHDVADQLAFRMGGEADHSFIFSSWLKSQWKLDAAKKMESEVFFPLQRQRIEKILVRSEIIVAFSPAEPGELLGYVVAEKILGCPVVHYLYVKQAFRRLGIARCLMNLVREGAPTGVMQHTHKTDARAKKLASKFRSTFNPYLAD